jgi:hypothetical protein
MQLVCQRNSLNWCVFTAQEIAELSEILTVQENNGWRSVPIACAERVLSRKRNRCLSSNAEKLLRSRLT